MRYIMFAPHCVWFERLCCSCAQENPDNYKELTSSFVTILRQVVGGKLPLDFNYHSVPAPWLQIQLLRILSLLGKEDQRYTLES